MCFVCVVCCVDVALGSLEESENLTSSPCPAQVMDMVKAGLLVSAMGVVILVSASFVLAPFIFDIDFGELPSWAVKQTPPT